MPLPEIPVQRIAGLVGDEPMVHVAKRSEQSYNVLLADSRDKAGLCAMNDTAM